MTTIRLDRPEDAARVRIVNELAFGRSAEAILVDRLRRSGAAVSLVAEDDAVVGQILFTPVVVEDAIRGRVRDGTGADGRCS